MPGHDLVVLLQAIKKNTNVIGRSPGVPGRRSNLKESVMWLKGGRDVKSYYVYIMCNVGNRVLYTGFSSDLEVRVYQHKHKMLSGFTSRYNITKLVYYEYFSDAYNAISREKQIKAGSRAKKIGLIEKSNPEWRDLSDGWFDE